MTETLEQQIVRLKREIEEREGAIKALVEQCKSEYKSDGIIEVGDDAIVLYTQHRLAPAKFEKAYPIAENKNLYKEAPDTTAIRKKLTDEEFKAVASPVRALVVKTLADARADEEKFKKEG